MPSHDLHSAARNGTLKDLPPAALTCKTLLTKDKLGVSSLYLAAIYGHLDQVPEAIRNDRDAMLTQDKWGQTPLHYAAMNGHLAQVPEAIRADREALLMPNENGCTPPPSCDVERPTRDAERPTRPASRGHSRRPRRPAHAG